MNFLENIEQSLVPETHRTQLTVIAAELADTFDKRQIFRTETEARVSVLDDLRRPTKASKYWQAVREQSVMLEQLVILSFEYRRNELKIKKLNTELSVVTNQFDRESLEIDLDEALFKRANILSVGKDRTRELLMWSKLKSELDDGNFDTSNCDTHQLVSYTAHFAIRLSVLDPSQMSGDEYSNLWGQLITSVKRCKETNALPELLCVLPPDIIHFLKDKNVLTT